MARLTDITNTRALYNHTGSSLTDATANGYDLTASGTAAYADGKHSGTTNYAFDFDNSWYAYRAGDFGLTNASDISIQFWVNIDTEPSDGVTDTLFSFVTNDAINSRRATHVTYRRSGANRILNFRHGGSNNDYTVTLTVGQWYFISLIIDKTNSLCRGYLDDTEVVNTTLATANSGNAVGLEISNDAAGSSIPSGTTQVDAKIDNFRIGNYARTAAEVADDFADAAATTGFMTTNSKFW